MCALRQREFRLQLSRHLPAPLCSPQKEKAAAAAAAGIRDRETTLVELRQAGGVARGQNTALEKGYLRLTSLPRC